MAEEERKTSYTALDLALDVLRAVDSLEPICNHPSLPRELAEECANVCKKLKEGALQYLESLKRVFRRRGRAWTTSKGGLKG